MVSYDNSDVIVIRERARALEDYRIIRDEISSSGKSDPTTLRGRVGRYHDVVVCKDSAVNRTEHTKRRGNIALDHSDVGRAAHLNADGLICSYCATSQAHISCPVDLNASPA